jgi:hypothetical protein
VIAGNATVIEIVATVNGTTIGPDMEIETGTVATGIAMNITGTGIVIMTGLAAGSGFVSKTKMAISIAGITTSRTLDAIKNPPA